MPLEFSFKYKNYELRACNKHLLKGTPEEPNETIDLVCWQNDGERDYCFSLAYFVRDKEGYDLNFVGNRPFDYIKYEDVKVVWRLLEYAQEILDKFFDEEVNHD